MTKFKDLFKSYFATGLLVLVPLAVTVILIRAIIEWVDEIFGVQAWAPGMIPGLGLAIALVVILLAGILGRNVFGKWLFLNFSHLVQKVPIVGAVYEGVRKTMLAIFSGGDKRFGRAVLVEYPRQGVWTIGLVTLDKAPAAIRNNVGGDLVSVYIPTTPNPTSGFLLYVPREELRPLNMKVDEALKLVVSLGLVEGPEEKKV